MSYEMKGLLETFAADPTDDVVRLVVADCLHEHHRFVEESVMRDLCLRIVVMGGVVWIVPLLVPVWESIGRMPRTRERVGDWLRWMRPLLIRAQAKHNGRHRMAEYHELCQEWSALHLSRLRMFGERKWTDWYERYAAAANLSFHALMRMYALLPLGVDLSELLPVR